MSTATKHSRKQNPEIDAWLTQDGETWWRCPDCRNCHSETIRACNCGRVRPPIARLTVRPYVPDAEPAGQTPADTDDTNGPAQVRAGGLENGRVAWECPVCRKMCDGVTDECGNCGFATRGIVDALSEQTQQKATKVTKEKLKSPAAPALLAGRSDHDVPLRKLHRRTDNPRQTFDLDKLQQLAESIRGVGLISRIIVRATDDGWELWAGERRVRAAELLGWTAIPARIFPAETPDATMEAVRAWENLQRADLDPLEESRSLQQLLASGAYASQKELGQALGLSQGEISLRLRLTELPEDWRQRIIAREISTSHAKHLYPWLDVPAVLVKAAKQLQDWEKNHGRQASERDFEGVVQAAARAASKPITKAGPFSTRDTCPFSVSPELRAQLDVRPLKNPWGGKPEPRAFNVTLWQQKAREAQRRAAEQAKAEAAAAPKGKAAPIAQAKAASKPPAGPGLSGALDILGRWAKERIKELLTPKDKQLLQRLMIIGYVVYDGLAPDVAGIGKRLQIKRAYGHGVDDQDAAAWWDKLIAVEDAQLPELMHAVVMGACGKGYGGLGDELALAVARSLGARPEESWRPQAADLTDYDEPALRALAAEFGHDVGKAKSKDALIKALVKCWKPGDLPAAFRAALEPEAR